MMKELCFDDAMQALRNREPLWGIRWADGQPELVELTGVFDGLMFLGHVEDVPKTRAEKPEPETEQAAKVAAKRKALDHGKILSLFEAGKTVAWIAKEMGCSEQAIRNHIKQEEERIIGETDTDAETAD